MTLNGVMALFCVISRNSIARLEADYVTVHEDSSVMYAEYPRPLLAKFDPRSSRAVSLHVIAQLLVKIGGILIEAVCNISFLQTFSIITHGRPRARTARKEQA